MHLLDVCSMFAQSCKRGIRPTATACETALYWKLHCVSKKRPRHFRP